MTESPSSPDFDPRGHADFRIVIRFDFDAYGAPLQASWPVTRATADQVEEQLAAHGQWDERFIFFQVNRSRRDVWINPQRVRECMILFDYLEFPSRPTVLSRSEDEDPETDALDIPHDLYPLCAIAFEGVAGEFDADTRWLALGDQDAASIAEMAIDLDEAGDATFLRFTDDDGEVRLIRRRDVAFVDIARLAYDKTGEPSFLAEA